MGNNLSRNSVKVKIIEEECAIYKNLCNEMGKVMNEQYQTEKELRKEISLLREELEKKVMKIQSLEDE